MSEPSSRYQHAPEPGSDDVPQWVNDLVPIAEYARALLRVDAPALALAVTAVLVLPQLMPLPAPWVTTACMALGAFLALRHGGPARISRRAGSAAADSPTVALRPGGRTGALLVVLDLLLSATGLAAWAGLALAGTERALLVAATGATAGLAVGVGLVAVRELVGRCSAAVRAAFAAVALAAVTAVVYGPVLVAPSWWWMLGLALLVDAVGAISLRVGARNDRRFSRPADAT
ncbi:hypothetical protein [Actinomyces ruminis]|uniref:Integral membrane protein n=1 Tax=Actinomyces ruminis TaxID=1937003 RepID=A0ABX4MD94_9ACTO|nr:hypothetical protein [Actinomyces ruminis]PHP53393.1 hypothetical protein BW737_002510 [Actinomyces ruminis]